MLGVNCGEDEGSGVSGPEPARRLTAVPVETPDKESTRALAVLVVEDDPSMRVLVSTTLELAGFRVKAAATGEQGLEMVASMKPDVVLLDVMLPDLGGFEVAEQLRGVPIVFLSARSSESDLARGREVGAIDYVPKPFDPIELPDRLREDLEELDRGGVEGVWALRFGPE